ncbi:MAG: NrdH-redoxin [Chloroflexi bacterium RBG_16_52_11]|nr:MAG: NrdH-redoxin [Chloroflexi bacterium RBG_16_52_11]
MPDNIVMYGTHWCGDCRRARRFFDQNEISYDFINIDEDKEAEKFVIKTNNGYRSVPTIIFPDGSILVEPSTQELAQKVGKKAKTSYY